MPMEMGPKIINFSQNEDLALLEVRNETISLARVGIENEVSHPHCGFSSDKSLNQRPRANQPTSVSFSFICSDGCQRSRGVIGLGRVKSLRGDDGSERWGMREEASLVFSPPETVDWPWARNDEDTD